MSEAAQQEQSDGPDLVQECVARHQYEPREVRGVVGEEELEVLVQAFVDEQRGPTLDVIIEPEFVDGSLVRGTLESVTYRYVAQLDVAFEKLAEGYGFVETSDE